MLRATPNVYVIRPADSLETLRSVEARDRTASGSPWVLVLTRQKLPFLGERDAAVSQGAYVLADAERRQPDLILIATGSEVSLAVDAKKILDGEGRADARRLDAVLGALRRPAAGVSRRSAAAGGHRPHVDRGRPRRSAGRSTSAIAASRSASIDSARRRRGRAIAKAFGFTPGQHRSGSSRFKTHSLSPLTRRHLRGKSTPATARRRSERLARQHSPQHVRVGRAQAADRSRPARHDQQSDDLRKGDRHRQRLRRTARAA